MEEFFQMQARRQGAAMAIPPAEPTTVVGKAVHKFKCLFGKTPAEQERKMKLLRNLLIFGASAVVIANVSENHLGAI